MTSARSASFLVSRRGFLRTTALGSVAALSGVSLAGCTPGQFLHGVASGDPTESSVVLWTRVTPEPGAESETLLILWEVCEDETFDIRVAAGLASTDASVDFTVKLEVEGLLPGKAYYYRFHAAEQSSPVGRTRTLPTGAIESFSIATVSCAHFAQGRFHVYRELSLRDDIELVVHLGDAIYESATSDKWLRPVEPAHALRTLSDYRARYAYYRSDADLRAVHARHPFVMVWDDHEVADNAFQGGASSHDDADGDYAARRAAAMQAYYEWLPIREPEHGDRTRIYRSLSVGSLLALHVLDTRHAGREPQLRYESYVTTGGALDEARFFTDLNAPTRTLLGAEQRAWLEAELSASSATWQVLAQQVLMAPMFLPSPIVLGRIGFGAYLRLVQRARTNPTSLTAAERALLKAQKVPYNLDAWDGYTAERTSLLARVRELDLNLLVLSGDSHNAWASDLRVGNEAVGAELATASVSARGLEGRLAGEDPALVARGAIESIETLRYAQTSLRGYLTLTFRESEVRARFHFVDSVSDDAYAAQLGQEVVVQRGPDGRRVSLT